MSEGELKYKIEGKVIGFFCGTYALEMTLEAMNASLSDLGELLNKRYMSTLRHYMYYSAEYYATVIKDQEFPYSEKDVFKWIDGTGGIEGEFYQKFNATFMRSMGIRTSDSQTTDTSEKKSQI